MKNAFETAVQLLSRRAHSQEELRRKLVAKGFAKPDASFAVEECLRLGFLDDAAFATSLTDEMLARGCGSRKIAASLSRRGVAKELVREAMETQPERAGSTDETSSAIEALRRKLKTFEREPDFRKRRLKAMRFLAGRGFGGDVANKALSAHSQLFRKSPTEGF
jgi:regulatory protein